MLRNTGLVRMYGQDRPIARGAEIFAERWTPLIIRNLYLGCGSFNEILEGAPGLSRTLLSQRLKQLERLGVVKSTPKLDGHGHHYELTSAGHDLFTVCQSLGEWGARWLEIAPENLDPFCGAVVNVPRVPPRPAPVSTRRHPLRLYPPKRAARRWACPPERAARRRGRTPAP